MYIAYDCMWYGTRGSMKSLVRCSTYMVHFRCEYLWYRVLVTVYRLMFIMDTVVVVVVVVVLTQVNPGCADLCSMCKRVKTSFGYD